MAIDSWRLVAAKGATAALLFGALGENPYSYYTLLRWVVACLAGYCAFERWKAGSRGWTWAFSVIAVLFNPVAPVHLDRAAWALIDVSVGIVFLGSVVRHRTVSFKPAKSEADPHELAIFPIGRDHISGGTGETLMAAIRIHPMNLDAFQRSAAKFLGEEVRRYIEMSNRCQVSQVRPGLVAETVKELYLQRRFGCRGTDWIPGKRLYFHPAIQSQALTLSDGREIILYFDFSPVHGKWASNARGAKTPPGQVEKPEFHLLLGNDGPIGDSVELLIQFKLGKAALVRTTRFKKASEMARFIHEQLFDLVFFYLGNVQWDIGWGNIDELLTRQPIEHSFVRTPTVADYISHLKSQYPDTPFITTQLKNLSDAFEGTGVVFIPTPFATEDFERAARVAGVLAFQGAVSGNMLEPSCTI
ncbi:MAG TPA: DUF6804 family protein [Verrucomicrobiae bacterium]|nr:DUF6804 family protein [Verrucomicrobiae bacterium]